MNAKSLNIRVYLKYLRDQDLQLLAIIAMQTQFCQIPKNVFFSKMRLSLSM